MLNDNWMLVTAGNDAKFNMMTARWGGLGVLFGKPVAFCFVSPLRYTWQLLDKGETYTLSFYTEAYRDALQICGTTSGSDTDKVKATGLTPVTTPSGAKAFGEAWMVVECRKLMQQSLSPGAIVDSAERANWNTKPLMLRVFPVLIFGEPENRFWRNRIKPLILRRFEVEACRVP